MDLRVEEAWHDYNVGAVNDNHKTFKKQAASLQNLSNTALYQHFSTKLFPSSDVSIMVFGFVHFQLNSFWWLPELVVLEFYYSLFEIYISQLMFYNFEWVIKPETLNLDVALLTVPS